MKNPVFFANKTKPQTLNIYQYHDNSFLKLSTLYENETTILNIPRETYIIVTVVDSKTEEKYETTLFESILQSYHNHFRF